MSHLAKQRALEAYAAGLLAPPAVAYLERHLTNCATCRAGLAAVQTYTRLRAEARELGNPTPSWERLTAALDAPAKRPAAPRTNTGKLIALAWPVLALAAALAIAWLGTLDTPVVAPRAQVAHPAAPSQAAATPRFVLGWVSLLAGSATLEQGTRRTPLTLASQLREGDLLSTGPNAQLHVQIEAADASAGRTGFALAPNTRLRIATLRAGDTRLELLSGRVASQVERLAPDAHYAVIVDDLSASVRGTRFWVERTSEVAVFVHEGRVEVARAGRVLASLAPGHGYPAARFAAAAAGAAERVHLPVAQRDEGLGLVLPALPSLRSWLVDGAPMAAAGGLAMRLPRGSHELLLEDVRGQLRTVRVDLTAPLTQLEPAALSALFAPKPAPEGSLSAQQIASVMRAGIEPLRRCYEHNLRVEPKLQGRFSVRMRVSAEGRVVRAEIDAAAKLPLELERCIESEVQKLVFPKPEGGGALSFEVPLNLKSL